MNAKVTLHKVKILKGHAPHGRWVTFATRKEAERYFNRCSEGSAKLFVVPPVER